MSGGMESREILLRGVDELGIDASGEQLALLELYCREIEAWNPRYKLVAAEGRELAIKHILDSLAPLSRLKALNPGSAADVGSGAGLPGIPLALFMTDTRFSLIERAGKRLSFLYNAIPLTGLKGRVTAVPQTLEEHQGAYDMVVFRAFRDFSAFYPALAAICRSGGVLAAYKGRRETVLEEIRAAGIPAGRTEIIPVAVPFLEAERHLLLVTI